MKMKNKKLFVWSFGAVAVFLSASLTVSVLKKPYSLENEMLVKVDLAGMKPVIAASSAWGGVRGSATFMRSVARSIDSLLSTLNSSGILAQSNAGPFTSGTSTFKISTGSYTPGQNEATGAAAPTYTKMFQICTNSSVSLQMFFNSATNPESNGGAVVIWKPQAFDSTLSSSANIKCSFGTGATGGANYVGTSAAGKKTMVCSWTTATPFDNANGGVITDAVLKAYDDTSGGQIGFLGFVKTKADFCNGTTGFGTDGTSTDVYNLAYLASKTSPYNTTAKFGALSAATAVSTANFASACTQTNPLNAGLFNTSVSGYFVSDGNASAPTGYPTVSSVDTVITNELVGMATPGGAISFQAGSCP
ncbi:MAG: hypothetical protein HY042_05300 [Spirochaetia bacterium]|nr:hypothetical protein [Spirochaetia bacterium]